MNNGFVNFPQSDIKWTKTKRKTWVNLVAFDVLNATDKNFSQYADTHLFLDGDFICDDAMTRPKLKKKLKKVTIDELLKEELDNQKYDNLYFPNLNVEYIQDFDITKWISTPLLNSTLIGWSDDSYTTDSTNWYCDFNNLTEEGKKLYYLMKKLYNNKEVRILTFMEKEFF